MNGLHLMPPVASSVAPRLDALFWFAVALCAVVALGVFATIVFLAVRYRRGSNASRAGGSGRTLTIELSWTFVSFALFIALFLWSLFLFTELHTPPRDAQTIYIVAKQWMWKTQHPGGQREINTLHVPLGKPMRLIMTSQDVIHSFYVPAFRVKQDVLPGRYTQLWFTATRAGTFPLFCTQYCGLDHAQMIGSVVVMAPADYAHWLRRQGTPSTLAQTGAALFRSRGCSGCHGTNAAVHAPELHGLFGRAVHLSDGSTVIADERYLRDSIMLPNLQIVAGFAPIMPSFAGQLDEDEVLALVAYLKSLATPEQDLGASP